MFILLSSGLFLGWSLGANDAANVFGTAVGSKMVRFRTAAWICSVFVILGATVSGAGAAHTLGKLGSVNALAGSFVVALAAALTVYWMSKLKMPVSTSQAIVGGIIGWNLFTGSVTDTASLTKIVMSWVLCPVLAALFAAVLFTGLRALLLRVPIHMLRTDAYTRLGLLAVGAFGSYSLGANNIANVMGVFVPMSPFRDLDLGWVTITGVQQLFFLGSAAIAVGVFTYSQKVMETVGDDLLTLSSLAALIVVAAESLVLFLFASEGLESWLLSHGLPSIPLVPVSSSQAAIGAILGIGLVQGGKGLRFRILGGISLGWVTTPVIAGVVAFLGLFVFQNVFDQTVFRERSFAVSAPVIGHLEQRGIPVDGLDALLTQRFDRAMALDAALEQTTGLLRPARRKIIEAAELTPFTVSTEAITRDSSAPDLSDQQWAGLKSLEGLSFEHEWQLEQALREASESWKPRSTGKETKLHNKRLRLAHHALFRILATSRPASGQPIQVIHEKENEE